jgi:ribonuclease H / adenosylcobalamin/alpha-ribazole phosphatase
VTRRLIVEADGGSRGNPGPAAYGAVVRDADTGDVLVEVAQFIGEATNNVAEYRGVQAGIEQARAIDPDCPIEARLDSKLVVEQMSGRWAIKNAGLRPLALEVRDVSAGVTFTWVPREQNAAADALANEALDAAARGRTELIVRHPSATAREVTALQDSAEDVVGEIAEDLARTMAPPPRKMIGWANDLGTPTLMLLGRHGATEFSLEKRFSGRGGADVGLAPVGVAQAEALAAEIVARDGVDVVITSPLLRTRQTAQIVADATAAEVLIHDDLAECSFGEWDGFTFDEVQRSWPAQLQAWLASTDVAPPGGESFAACRDRVDAARRQMLAEHAGQRIAVISHVTPIKLMVGLCIDAPLHSLYRMELRPCSISTIAWFADGNSSMFGFAESAHLRRVDAGFGI